jgi:hypothetical protein
LTLIHRRAIFIHTPRNCVLARSKEQQVRKEILQMMTTLNGRLEDPDAWVVGIPDDLYSETDRFYSTFDTVLVGKTTYEKMAAYWPAR